MTERLLLPIYTAQSCGSVPYQLNWSYSVFWRDAARPESEWLEDLQEVLEARDKIRLLGHRLRGERTSQFLVSTRPQLAPVTMMQRIKGRMQHLLPVHRPFRRNYSLASVGSARASGIDRYIANQVEHHWSTNRSVMRRLNPFQFLDPGIDLTRLRYSSHGRYMYNLQIVLKCKLEEREFGWELMPRIHDRVVQAAAYKEHLLSRASLLPDHLHMGLGCTLSESPEQVALSYLNNLAHACDMKPVFQHGYYVGTFGEYDLGAVQN